MPCYSVVLHLACHVHNIQGHHWDEIDWEDEFGLSLEAVKKFILKTIQKQVFHFSSFLICYLMLTIFDTLMVWVPLDFILLVYLRPLSSPR